MRGALEGRNQQSTENKNYGLRTQDYGLRTKKREV